MTTSVTRCLAKQEPHLLNISLDICLVTLRLCSLTIKLNVLLLLMLPEVVFVSGEATHVCCKNTAGTLTSKKTYKNLCFYDLWPQVTSVRGNALQRYSSNNAVFTCVFNKVIHYRKYFTIFLISTKTTKGATQLERCQRADAGSLFTRLKMM